MLLRLRWLVVALLFVCGAINYLDRSALSIAAPFVIHDLGLSPAQLGLVFSSFGFGYAIFCLVGGYAADRLGPRKVFVWATTTWSFFCALTAAASSFSVLFVVRALFGMSEGPLISTGNKMISNWFPHTQRAIAFSVANSGQPIGAALAGPVVGLLALTYGWWTAFVVIAVLGVVWTAAWLVVARDHPEQHPRLRGTLPLDLPKPPAVVTAEAQHSLTHYLFRPMTLAVAFALFTYFYVLFFFITWFPSYLTMELKLSVSQMGLFNSLPWIAGFVGYICGGVISDYVLKRTANAVLARKIIMIGSLTASAACIALVSQTADIHLILLLTSLAVFANYLSANTYFVIVIDTVEPARVGVVTGFVHMWGIIAGIVAPAITGFLVQYSGSFKSAFLLTGIIAISGALTVLAFVRTPQVAGRAAAQFPKAS